MSYHFAFLSPRFNLAFLASDTRLTTHYGETRRIKDGVRKVQKISDFAWLSWNGFQPFAQAYTEWLKKRWHVDVRSAKPPGEFLRDPEFHEQSRSFCESELNRLKGEYQQGDVLINELIHMVLIGMTTSDEPFFLAINHGGPDIFSHHFVSKETGEFPHVHPLEEEDVLEWVRHGLGAIQASQAAVTNREEFIRRAQKISVQVFKEISVLTTGVSPLCDCVVITPEISTVKRREAEKLLSTT